MSYTKVITDEGYDLLRAAPGHQLVYSRAACGSGTAEAGQLKKLTDLTDYVMDLSIMEVKPTETAATLRLQLDNRNAPREFQLQQIGIFAMLLDGDKVFMPERLLQISEYDKPDIVRKIPHVSEYVVSTLMGDAESVEGIIDMAAYVSIRQFLELQGALNIAQPTELIATIEHNLQTLPTAALYPTTNAYGRQGYSQGAYGGTVDAEIAVRLQPVGWNTCRVFTIPQYAGEYTVKRLTQNLFALLPPGGSTTLTLKLI